MSARSNLGWLVMFCAVPAYADKGAIAPTGATAVPKIEVVTQPAFTNISCGAAITASMTIKNLGNAFNSKIVVNGTETAFSLAKGETKTLTGPGGTLDCAKAPTITLKIPSPAGTGPLFQRSFAPAAVKYNNAVADVAGGGKFAINVAVTGAACGSPTTIHVKSTVTTLPVTVSLQDEKLTATIPGGGAKVLVTTKNFDCTVAPPNVRYYTTSPQWLDLTPASVSFK